ncbi:MAG: hypothetical protein AB1547_08625, partial [Thermodesulfobacteriota bacterium]
GGARGRMISAPDRRNAVELIDEARQNGARLEAACRELKLTARTYQRWTRCGDVGADKRPQATRPTPSKQAVYRGTGAGFADLS